MLTPIGVTTSDYWDAIKAGNRQHIRLTFQNGATLDDSDVNITGIEINDMLNGDTGLSFGKAVMKEFTAKLFNNSSIRTFSWGSEFALELGVEINGTTNWVTVGLFSGNRPENYPVNGVIEFHAYDRMRTMDVPASDYLRSIQYPATFADIYHGLCTFVGLQYEDGDELPNIMSRSFPASPMGTPDLTCRDVLGLLAEACGCYARINASGKVQMVWFSDQTGTEIDADYEFDLSALNIGSAMIWNVADTYTWDAFEGFTWDDLDGYKRAFHFDALNVRSSDNDIGVTVPEFGTGYTYYIIDNPFLYTDNDSDVEDYIQPIYDRLDAFEGYLPMTVECVGNWLVESGDILTVDFHGESVEMPIFVQTIRWSGAVRSTYEATGTLDKDYLPSSTHEKLTQMGRMHEIKVTIDGNYEKIQDQFGNYYTKVETAQYVQTKMSDALGNYYTKTETANEISMYVGNHAYEIVSGIAINANGVNVTGSKYVRITAATNTYWEYNQNGLEYYTSGVNRPLIRFGARLTGTSIPSVNCGVFEFNDGDTTAGKMALVAMNHSQNKYDYFLIKLASVNSDLEMSLLPSGSTKAFLGSSSNDFRGLYVRNIYGTNSVGELNVFTKPSGTKGFSLWEASNTNDVYISTYQYVHAPQAVTSVCVYGKTITPSSRYVKKNIKKIECNDAIDKLIPVSFEYKGDKVRHNGLIYEDTIDIMPEICNCDEMGRKGINYVELVPVLLKEIQNIRKRLKDLESKVMQG